MFISRLVAKDIRIRIVYTMNIVLFEPEELGTSLPYQDVQQEPEMAPSLDKAMVFFGTLSKHDPRTIHLLKVLHKKKGDIFDAGITGGKKGEGYIQAILSDGSLEYSLLLTQNPPSRLPIRIGVGFPRPIQLRRILRDLSNFGVEAIDVIGTELGEKSYQDTTLFEDGGAYAALLEGAIQARDTRIPELSVYRSLKQWLNEKPWKTDSLLVAPDNINPQISFIDVPYKEPAIVLAIGSERGWSSGERTMLESSGFIRVSLGERALRTEIACITSTVIALEKIGYYR